MGSHILYYLPTHPIITLLLKEKKNDFDSALHCSLFFTVLQAASLLNWQHLLHYTQAQH